MNLARTPVWLWLLLTAALLLFLPVRWPAVKIYFFAPLLIITYYQYSLLGCLWIALACGTLIDLLSVHAFSGLNALVYSAATYLFYPQRKHFFADRASTLPLMTFLFSMTAGSLLLLCASLLEGKQLFSWRLAIADLIVMPALDALYALVCFVLPMQLLKQLKGGRKRAY